MDVNICLIRALKIVKAPHAIIIAALLLGCIGLLPAYGEGRGIPTSMFNTYIQPKEFIFYGFYEYYYNKDEEYNPEELGYVLDEDFEGVAIEHEFLIYVAYGFNEWIMAEFEMAYIAVDQAKSDDDTSAMPSLLEEEGIGDVEGQIRWRYRQETESGPEIFSYFEIVTPAQRGSSKVLVGNQDWEFKLGVGVAKGFDWGVVTFRLSAEYDGAEEETELGEYAIEYATVPKGAHRAYAGIEGAGDEAELILEYQWYFQENACWKFGSGFGLTPASMDIAPETGVMFRF